MEFPIFWETPVLLPNLDDGLADMIALSGSLYEIDPKSRDVKQSIEKITLRICGTKSDCMTVFRTNSLNQAQKVHPWLLLCTFHQDQDWWEHFNSLPVFSIWTWATSKPKFEQKHRALRRALAELLFSKLAAPSFKASWCTWAFFALCLPQFKSASLNSLHSVNRPVNLIPH